MGAKLVLAAIPSASADTLFDPWLLLFVGQLSRCGTGLEAAHCFGSSVSLPAILF
jgi:hypothetical protein